MSKRLENIITTGIIVFLLITGTGVYSCDKMTKQEGQLYYKKEEKREAEFMDDCLKSLSKYECIYRWQSAIRASGK